MVKEKNNDDLSLDDSHQYAFDKDPVTDTSFEDAVTELKITKDELFKYQKLYNETLNKLKYSLADFDNFRKNIEKQNLLKIFSIRSNLLLNIINFREDLNRAIDTMEQQPIADSIVEGLKNILKGIDIFLDKENVKEIVSVNEEFNPNLHEILGFSYMTDDNEIKENIVTKEIRKGYLLDDRVIRPSLVEVSKKIIKNNDNNNDNST